MLVSHRRRFIYLKTKKTAGTSVEVFFERECVPEGTYSGSHHDAVQRVSDAGIIGSRMDGRTPNDQWVPHMRAAQVRAQIGEEIWNTYLKFCVIRNPYDKMVSRWWWDLPEPERQERANAPFHEVRAAFNAWLAIGEARAFDRDIYMIDGKPCMDRFLRYERLWDDIHRLCAELGIVRERSELGHYKSETRRRPEHFSEYYDERGAARIAALFDWEIERFDYTLEPVPTGQTPA
jgi:hypothetical protein